MDVRKVLHGTTDAKKEPLFLNYGSLTLDRLLCKMLYNRIYLVKMFLTCLVLAEVSM